MARRKRGTEGGEASAPAPAIETKAALRAGPETPVYYVNYAEAAFTAHEFSLTAGRTPAKLTADQLEAARKGEVLTFDAEIQLIIPPTMVPGLIRALTITKDQYEKATGATIKDVGGSQ